MSFIFFFFLLGRAACGILVPRPGIEPMAPAVEARSLNRWTARDVLLNICLKCIPPQIVAPSPNKSVSNHALLQKNFFNLSTFEIISQTVHIWDIVD